MKLFITTTFYHLCKLLPEMQSFFCGYSNCNRSVFVVKNSCGFLFTPSSARTKPGLIPSIKNKSNLSAPNIV